MSIKSETIYRSEGFEFRLITDFVKWPDGTTRPVCQVCYSKNELFVCTRDKHMPIAVFDMDGNFKRSFGESLPFNRTHGLFVNKDEELFVCDDGRHVVYKLDIYGNLLQTFGELDKHCDNGYDITVEWPHDLYTIKRAGEPFNRPTSTVPTDMEMFPSIDLIRTERLKRPGEDMDTETGNSSCRTHYGQHLTTGSGYVTVRDSELRYLMKTENISIRSQSWQRLQISGATASMFTSD